MNRAPLAVVAIVSVAACTRPRVDPPPRPVAVAGTSASATAVKTIGGDRAVDVFVPPSYREGTPAPVVLMLHAYGVNGALEELFFRLEPWARSVGFLYIAPDGTPNGGGRSYWNATDACCAPQLADGKPTEPDDEAYLIGLLDELKTKFTVDPKRVFLVGHSNGAFMAHRLACTHPDRFAAVVSVAGATFADAAKCPATSPVSLLQIHGTADATIRYDGGAFFGHPYPSARATAERWASIDGCADKPVESGALDIDGSIVGAETKVLKWASCKADATVELWTIEGGAHVPLPTTELARRIVEFLFAHPKP